MVLIVVLTLASTGGDPLELARLGTRYSLGDPAGSQGYDGQFVYFIAVEPDPMQVASRLDVPAYRYQRILLPLLARLVGLGQPGLIAWAIPLVGILAHALGVWAVAELLSRWGVWRGVALVYGLWVGFGLAVRLDLPETLAYSLVTLGLLAGQRSRPNLQALCWGLSLFAKEVALPFIGAQLIVDLFHKRWRDALRQFCFALVPFALFQFILWATFGQPGLGTGGDMATGFEWIPFMGLLRIGAHSLLYLVAMLVVFGPLIILPAVWGAWAALRCFVRGEWEYTAINLLLHALLIATLPFSTFRETGGLLRFACGLVLSVLLFAGQRRMSRILNYSWIWLVLNVFLLKT